ncbi:hypothetical protein MG293_000034 [Ovis ammon polii]|uniref:Uncharacterized protein n=1 Tax=Ovis ammon polii TaxID=230172 RepID=A0AAD4YGT4_OVIAM|nr:hypothetical protein MG293_000034 [Ovis ammon polii]
MITQSVALNESAAHPDFLMPSAVTYRDTYAVKDPRSTKFLCFQRSTDIQWVKAQERIQDPPRESFGSLGNQIRKDGCEEGVWGKGAEHRSPRGGCLAALPPRPLRVLRGRCSYLVNKPSAYIVSLAKASRCDFCLLRGPWRTRRFASPPGLRPAQRLPPAKRGSLGLHAQRSAGSLLSPCPRLLRLLTLGPALPSGEVESDTAYPGQRSRPFPRYPVNPPSGTFITGTHIS